MFFAIYFIIYVVPGKCLFSMSLRVMALMGVSLRMAGLCPVKVQAQQACAGRLTREIFAKRYSAGSWPGPGHQAQPFRGLTEKYYFVFELFM